jgi:hypothetical protein
MAEPGEKLLEVMGWLYDRITRYPYYWPYEGTYIDKFSYDFEIEMSSDNKPSSIEITQIAYEILKEALRIQPVDPANPGIDVQTDKVNGGGALVKLSVTLDNAQPVSELNLAPFTKYPLELVSFMYEEDIETFHPKKEIIIPKENIDSKKFSQTTQSIRFQFPVVIAKRFTIILRQQNYEKDTYLVAEEAITKDSLWAAVSKREAEITLDTTDGLETITSQELDKLSGWDIYLEQLAKYQNDLKKWEGEVEIYKQKEAERNAAIKEKLLEEVKYRHAMSEYRTEYSEAVKKYQTRVDLYEKELEQYNFAYAKYQRDLVLYNQYLRSYAAWQSGNK